MTLKWRLLLGVAVVFCAGVATGLFAGAWHAHHAFMIIHSGHVGHRMREHLRRELKLTPDQFEKISPLIDQLENRLEAIRTETGRRVSETMTQSHQEIAPYLTPEQRARMDEMAKKHRRILHMQELPPPPPPGTP